VEKHVEVRRQQEALIKKRKAAMSEINQEIYKATDESVATLHAVYGEACTVLHVSKRVDGIETRPTEGHARLPWLPWPPLSNLHVVIVYNQSFVMLPAYSRVK
jgi:hypothetical protein